jgi:hypothetical protein
VVVDNSMVFTRGTIRVRIAGFYNRKNFFNLEENFAELEREGILENSTSRTQFSNDLEAKISSFTGGGRNYGAFYVPQINEKGIVAFLGGSKTKPVWLGGLFEVKRDDNFEVEYVNFPTDRFIEGENTDGVIGGQGNIGDEVEPQEEKSFIIRTKHTNRNSQSEIDFQQQETSNIISVGKKRVRLTHFPENSWEDGTPKNYKDFIIGVDENNEEKIELSIVKDQQKKATLTLKEDKITLANKNGENKISFSEDNEIEITNESGSKIIMKNDGNIELLSSNEVHIVGSDDNLVKYSDLKTIIEEFQDHIHIAPTGPTSPALASNQAPIASKVLSPSLDMKSEKGKVS